MSVLHPQKPILHTKTYLVTLQLMLTGHLAGLLPVDLVHLAPGASLVSAIVILSISKLLDVLPSANPATLHSILLENSLEVVGVAQLVATTAMVAQSRLEKVLEDVDSATKGRRNLGGSASEQQRKHNV
jgi:hypothetical protein